MTFSILTTKGGASGIGRAVAEMLARRGYELPTHLPVTKTFSGLIEWTIIVTNEAYLLTLRLEFESQSQIPTLPKQKS